MTDRKWVKDWIDQNVWDGEDRSGCDSDWARFTPDDLQELIDDMLDAIEDELKENKDDQCISILCGAANDSSVY